MGKWVSFWKSLSRSLLRIALLLLIAVVSLFILVLIYSAVNDDIPSNLSINGFVYFVKNGDVPPVKIYTTPKLDLRLLHGYSSTSHYNEKKPTLLQSLKDMYMGWKYGPDYLNTKINQPNRPVQSRFTEKIIVVYPLTNWDTKLADFCKNTGFTGKIDNQEITNSHTWKARNFDYMEGSFNLDEPKDTLSFRRNADFLVNFILALYQGEKAPFKLSQQPIYEEPRYYNHVSKKVTGYHVYYEQVLEQKIPHLSEFSIDPRLNISYNIEAKNYQISNLLFATPTPTPKDKVGKEAALRLARKIVKERNKLPDSVLDTLSAEIWKEYTVRYPETKSPYYYYVQSVWYVNFPWALYSSSFVGFDITYNDVYLVDAYSGKVYGQYDYPY